MGEIADAMLDGTLCQSCGEYLGAEGGYPQSCPGCVRETTGRKPTKAELDAHSVRTKEIKRQAKRRREKRRLERRRSREARIEALEAENTELRKKIAAAEKEVARVLAFPKENAYLAAKQTVARRIGRVLGMEECGEGKNGD